MDLTLQELGESRGEAIVGAKRFANRAFSLTWKAGKGNGSVLAGALTRLGP